MVASQIRANARESLTGKWGKAALMTLTYAIIVFVIEFVCALIPVVGQLIVLAISTPISYGLIVSFMKLKRGEEIGYTDFLSNGFSSFGKVWAVIGNTILKMILPICLIVIFAIMVVFGFSGSFLGMASNSMGITSSTGIVTGFSFVGIIGSIGYIVAIIYTVIKSYLYSLTLFILNDNSDMTGKQIVEESEKLMRGNRWRFFWLGLTFIGWYFLSVFTLGIGMLWLMPYVMVAMICFYEDLVGKLSAPVAESETKTEE